MQKAKDFTLPGTNGTYSLSQELTKGPVILIFYPKDNTPG